MIALVVLNLGNATAAERKTCRPEWRGAHRQRWNALLDGAPVAKFGARAFVLQRKFTEC